MAALEVLTLNEATPQAIVPQAGDTYSLPRATAINAGTLTTDVKALDLSATCNNAAVTFTGFKLNLTDTASAAASLLMDLQVGGVTLVGIRKDGEILANQGRGITINSGNNQARLYQQFNQTLTIMLSTNNSYRFDTDGFTAGSLKYFGWTENSNVSGNKDLALARNAAGVVEVNNGTRGQFRDLKLRNLTSTGGVIANSVYTVGTLPSASASGAGAQAFVTDALTPVFGNAVDAGGAVKTPVYSDGTNWIVG